MTSYSAELNDDILSLSTGRITRRYRWNNGHLISLSLEDGQDGRVWPLAGDAPDLAIPGLDAAPSGASLTVEDVAATAVTPAHGRVQIDYSLGSLQVRRIFRLFSACQAIACDIYLRGSAPAQGLESSRLERIAAGRPHLRLTCVQFFDYSDRCNNMVHERSFLPYRYEERVAGNLILIRDALDDSGIFLLKEAPCSDAQLAWPGYDFAYKAGEIALAGPGVVAADLLPEEWTRCYGFVTGMAGGSEFALISALRSYQDTARLRQPGRDEMILLNTWGDRGQDTRIGEAFALAELEAAARLGVTHFQLDDGWEKGRTPNSATPGGAFTGMWERSGFWDVHPERFPRGLTPVIQRGRELGVQIGLWFNPSKDNSYANWQKDASVLIDMYRRYGIRTFKIDGVDMLDKQGDRNMRAMLDAVRQATNDDVVFNLDITAGHRWGYHLGFEFGNLFLENRYTDVPNYYPHWTLRNLWQLSRYVPPQRLQIEFLNRWRNAAKYASDDPLAPSHVPFAYCFAITMMAQPLAWFEASNLPEEAFSIAPLIQTYRRHIARIHAGHIFPIGEEPSGTGWTGFQSLASDNSGYLLVFREYNDRPAARISLWNLEGRLLACTHIAGSGASFDAEVAADGSAEVSLPQKFSFGLYEYNVE